MKIINLIAENFKRISVVEIHPEGNFVQISGKNGQGKTSVLDAIWAAIGGLDHTPSTPIRRGAKEARIVLDLGELIVTRTFSAADGEKPETTRLKVENAQGFRPSSPQKLLDTLVSSVSFDPLAFVRAAPKAQFEILRGFVPDVNFTAIDKANKADFTERQDVNRSLKAMRATIDAAIVPSGLPADYVDEKALVERLAFSGTLEVRRSRREDANRTLAGKLQQIKELEDGIPAVIEEIAKLHGETRARLMDDIAEAEDRLARLRVVLDGQKMAQEEAVIGERDRLTAIANNMRAVADRLRTTIETAPPLPDPIDGQAIQAELEDARRINDGVRARREREALVQKADSLEALAAGLTKKMEGRAAHVEQAVRAAKLPVDGLGFGDDFITLNGLPFEQASDAEQLRTSVAIAMAGNPKLRVIRIRDGSLLDDDGLKALAEMADRYDCQVWIEVVDNTGTSGFVMEDGALASRDAWADLVAARQADDAARAREA